MVQAEREVLSSTEEIFTSKLIAERFLGILQKKWRIEEDRGFTLHSIEFDVESTTQDPDGTKHTIVKPVVTEEVNDFGDATGRFLGYSYPVGTR